MLIGAFFSWWYGKGWKHAVRAFPLRLKGTSELFSVSQLLRTLFQPWRRIVTVPGDSFDDKLHAWGDNLVSRGIGFVVRAFVLIAAFLSLVIVGCLTAAEIVIWPLAPVAVPLLLVKGLI
jgi:hypothetical protein